MLSCTSSGSVQHACQLYPMRDPCQIANSSTFRRAIASLRHLLLDRTARSYVQHLTFNNTHDTGDQVSKSLLLEFHCNIPSGLPYFCSIRKSTRYRVGDCFNLDEQSCQFCVRELYVKRNQSDHECDGGDGTLANIRVSAGEYYLVSTFLEVIRRARFSVIENLLNNVTINILS
ncbi:hypothetical protein BDR04DRAFT_1144417 [Suillus decipiens]|nr:hypothetical protein BDR04DRAFT_1144417 [Suillus decipiens]